MAPTIKIFETIDELALYFASLLLIRFRKTPRTRSYSWVLSGGSTPKSIFTKVAFQCRETIDWNRVNIFWGDERCVDPENGESNFKMAREHLLNLVPVPLSNIFRIRGEAEPVSEAGLYASGFALHVNAFLGIPQPDLLMLGVGEDGHTASIFPKHIDLFDSNLLYEPTEHPDTGQKRITATGKIINHAKTVVIVAAGESKAARVSQIINHSPGWEQLPAGRIHSDNGEVIWLLDKDAASLLRLK